MILYSFIIFSTITVVIYLSFYSYFKSNNFSKKKIKIKLGFLVLIFSTVCIFFYFKTSNFWIGNSLLEKIAYKTKVTNKDANKIAILNQAKVRLIKALEEDPKNLELLLQLAETTFILGFYEESINLYKKASYLDPENLEIKKAEMRVRLVIENNNVSSETINLIRNILKEDPNNMLALYVIGNYEYERKNDTAALKFFENLKPLLKEESQEYNEINNKILDIEKRYEKNNR